jgi:hypothetical protein
VDTLGSERLKLRRNPKAQSPSASVTVVSAWNDASSCALLTTRSGGGYPWKREAEAEAEPKGPVAECFGNGCK